MLVFLFCCLVCLRPELTVLFYLTQIHHVDQTRLENRVLSTYFSQVLGIRYTATVRFKLLYFLLWSVDNQWWDCALLPGRGNAWTLPWGFCTGTECCKIAAVWFLWLRIVCLWSPLFLLRISWQTNVQMFEICVNESHIPQNKVKSSEGKRKFSWNVLSSSCVSLWEV